MEETDEKHNPNSHERLKSWSDLPLDLLISVFERLSFANFQRVKSVCSSWHYASRQCVPKNQIPWLILFPKDNENNNNYSCMLFNPEEQDKLYRTQDLGLEFAKSFCIATYGSWLLMRDLQYNPYIVNLFTHERINLPPAESQLGMKMLERIKDNGFCITSHNGRQSERMHIRSPVFWIDEKTKDHVVSWGLGSSCVVYSKKGDNSWNQIPGTSDCCDMVYKDRKLYFLSYRGFNIFDFSGEIPQQTFHCFVHVERLWFGLQRHEPSNSWRLIATKLIVTVTGEVFKVEQLLRPRSRRWSFRVFKVNTSGFLKKHELINSLGDESMLFDQGITVLANDTDGLIRNSIYFSACRGENTNHIAIFLFNLKTRKMEPLHTFDSSSVQFSRARDRWFLPSFTHTRC